MVLDALTAIGLASSIVQFVDFTTKLFAKATELEQSLDGSDKESANLETTTEILGRLGESLSMTFESVSQEEKDILTLAEGCKEVVDELLDVLRKLKSHPKQNKWQNLRQALRYIWAHDRLEKMSKTVDQFRMQLGLSLNKLLL
jgi:hypothetical protein